MYSFGSGLVDKLATPNFPNLVAISRAHTHLQKSYFQNWPHLNSISVLGRLRCRRPRCPRHRPLRIYLRALSISSLVVKHGTAHTHKIVANTTCLNQYERSKSDKFGEEWEREQRRTSKNRKYNFVLFQVLDKKSASLKENKLRATAADVAAVAAFIQTPNKEKRPINKSGRTNMYIVFSLTMPPHRRARVIHSYDM